MQDMITRYAPESVRIVSPKLPSHSAVVPVKRHIVHQPQNHTGSPIRDDMTALECVTDYGSRWYGIDKGWINSELRMVIQGTNKKDTARMNWPECNTT